jgi:hypothetical protein
VEIVGRILGAFPDRGLPPRDSLVVFDGFDQLDKESALATFAGKTRDQVGELVGRGPGGWMGLWGIEELSVLEPAALQYYLEPFLLFLAREEYTTPEDVSFWLSYHLCEQVRLRGPDIFDAPQREVLIELARHFESRLTAPDDWADAHRKHYSGLIEALVGATRLGGAPT